MSSYEFMLAGVTWVSRWW